MHSFAQQINQSCDDTADTDSASLVRSLWGIDWTREFPMTLTPDGLRVEYTSFASAARFISRNYAEIFEQSDDLAPFAGGPPNPARARYYRQVGDFFEFMHEDETVGIVICTPLDWSTYYLRSGGLVPAYQDRKLMQRFLPNLFAILTRAGVERVEVDISPSNFRMMTLLTRLRFNISGTVLTERWGAHVHYTRFLSAASEQIFLDQFCSGVKCQSRERDSGIYASHELAERR